MQRQRNPAHGARLSDHNLGGENDIAGWLSRGTMTSFSLTVVTNVIIK
jgi:hypothetical protein